MMKNKWFALAVALFALAGAAALFLSSRERRETTPAGLGQSFAYSLDEYSRTDPALIVARETGRVALPLQAPAGLAADAEGNLYVVGDRSLLVYGANGAQRGGFALADSPRCVFADEGGVVFVGFRDRVAVYGADGKHLADWKSLGPDAVITSIAAADGHVFVADAGNRIVHRYGREGTRTGAIGAKGDGGGGPPFIVPSPYFDLALGAGNALWVVDPGRRQLRNYDYDGRVRSSWGETSMSVEGFCGCCNPTHIAIRADGSFVTSEKGYARVKLYSELGEFKGVVAGAESFDKDAHGLDLAVDAKDRVLVLDPARRAVRVFALRETR
ncbi:MAG: hypothetical protein FJ225_13345 [Lentisphaerae bacterium]|nr:hypothetical protein [Lentisphaerota bacterium]